jgi:hypothetical protein
MSDNVDIAHGIEALKRLVGAANDAELAKRLEIQRSAIAQWKKRGRIPDKARRRAEDFADRRDRETEAVLSHPALPTGMQNAARALALRYLMGKTPGNDLSDSKRMFILANFFTGLERASYLALNRHWESFEQTLQEAYHSLFADDHLNEKIEAELEGSMEIGLGIAIADKWV